MSENDFEIAIGSFLLVGILCSFLPQYYRIINKGTSEGLSSWYFFIGCGGSFTALSNGLIFYWPAFKGCSDQSSIVCYHEVLGFLQLAVLWIAFYLEYIFFYMHLGDRKYSLFNDEYRPMVFEEEESAQDRKSRYLFRASIVWIAVICLTNFGAIYNGYEHEDTLIYAQVLGGISMISGFVQYLPQIHHTYSAWDYGSLSITSLFMKVPGSYLWVYFLTSQESADYTTWLPFLSAAMLQTFLLGLCLKIRYDNKKAPVWKIESINL